MTRRIDRLRRRAVRAGLAAGLAAGCLWVGAAMQVDVPSGLVEAVIAEVLPVRAELGGIPVVVTEPAMFYVSEGRGVVRARIVAGAGAEGHLTVSSSELRAIAPGMFQPVNLDVVVSGLPDAVARRVSDGIEAHAHEPFALVDASSPLAAVVSRFRALSTASGGLAATIDL